MPKTTIVKDGYNTTDFDTFTASSNYTLPDFSSIPLYLLDGPATSFFSEMILYSNGREVERIQEYD